MLENYHTYKDVKSQEILDSNSELIIECYSDLGITEADLGNFEEAIKDCNLGLDEYKKIDKVNKEKELGEGILGKLYFGLGKANYNLGNIDEAKSYLEQALNIFENVSLDGLLFIEIIISETYGLLASLSKDEETTKKYHQLSLKYAKKIRRNKRRF